MKIELESTSKVVELIGDDGGVVPARIWEGCTAAGVPVHCYITRIAVALDQDQSQFVRELQEHRAPSTEVQAIPLRLIL